MNLTSRWREKQTAWRACNAEKANSYYYRY